MQTPPSAFADPPTYVLKTRPHLPLGFTRGPRLAQDTRPGTHPTSGACIMNTITGDCLNNPDRYGDEVLNANGLPQMVLIALGLQPAARPQRASAPSAAPEDAEEFMRRLYRAQE